GGQGSGRAIGFDDPDDYRRARDAFEGAGYSDEGVRQALGLADILDLRPIDRPAGLRRTRAATPLHLLARLFFLPEPMELAAARGALAPLPIERWARAGLIGVDGERATPSVKVTPYRDLLVAGDLSTRMRRGGPDDFVLGVSKSAVLLGHTIVPRPLGHVLDLGTGGGILALLASRGSARVYATDKNARAVQFARFNAALNSIANLTCAA